MRDKNDVQKLIDWFSKNPPFPEMEELVILSTGVVIGKAAIIVTTHTRLVK